MLLREFQNYPWTLSVRLPSVLIKDSLLSSRRKSHQWLTTNLQKLIDMLHMASSLLERRQGDTAFLEEFCESSGPAEMKRLTSHSNGSS